MVTCIKASNNRVAALESASRPRPGFLRIRDSKNPLDASAVHPERYALVERMAQDFGVDVRGLVGDAALASRIDVRTLDDLAPGMEMEGSCRSASGHGPGRGPEAGPGPGPEADCVVARRAG